MAGVQALIDQANGGRQGMPAYIYYTLAANQNTTNCNSSLPPTNSSGCAFQDITVGNNLICGLSSCSTSTPAAKIGFQAGTGYDMATGLGSVNAANLASQWGSVTFSSSNVTLGLSQTSFVHGTPITLNGTVAPGSGSGTPTGDVAFIVSQGAIGDTVNTDTGALNGPAAFTTVSGGSYSAVLNNLPGGTYYVTARYGGDETLGSSYSTPVQVTVQAENDTLSLTAFALNGSACTLTSGSTFPYDSGIWLDAQVTANSGAGAPTGTVSITVDGNPYATLTLDPNGHALALSGSIGTSNCLYGYDYSNTSTIAAGPHTVAASYSGDSGFDPTNATPLNITVNQLTPSLSLAAGATQITSGFPEQLTATLGSLPGTGQQIGTVAPTGTVMFTDTTTSTALGVAPGSYLHHDQRHRNLHGDRQPARQQRVFSGTTDHGEHRCHPDRAEHQLHDERSRQRGLWHELHGGGQCQFRPGGGVHERGLVQQWERDLHHDEWHRNVHCNGQPTGQQRLPGSLSGE
jgi:trimeric autotransporter adhesin